MSQVLAQSTVLPVVSTAARPAQLQRPAARCAGLGVPAKRFEPYSTWGMPIAEWPSTVAHRCSVAYAPVRSPRHHRSGRKQAQFVFVPVCIASGGMLCTEAAGEPLIHLLICFGTENTGHEGAILPARTSLQFLLLRVI